MTASPHQPPMRVVKIVKEHETKRGGRTCEASSKPWAERELDILVEWTVLVRRRGAECCEGPVSEGSHAAGESSPSTSPMLGCDPGFGRGSACFVHPPTLRCRRPTDITLTQSSQACPSSSSKQRHRCGSPHALPRDDQLTRPLASPLAAPRPAVDLMSRRRVLLLLRPVVYLDAHPASRRTR